MRPLTILGYLLWRGGLMLAAGSALYLSFWWLLAAYPIPGVLKTGLGLTAVGLCSLILSFILERRADSRYEARWQE